MTTCPRCGAPVVEIGPEGGRCARGHAFARAELSAATAASAGEHRLHTNGAVSATEAVPLRERDATELLSLDIPDHLPSLPLLGQAGYVVKGWSHLVAGYPKAGKTELVFACARDWLADGTRVLWLTEESELVWAHRVRQHPSLSTGLSLVFALGEPPDRLLARVLRGSEPVVVVDTIRSLLGIADETDNAEIARTMGVWERAATGKTRLYLHHLRKGLGDHGLAVAGGTMLVGAVDRVLELRHDEHDSQRRMIRVHSRVMGAPDLLLGLDADGCPVALGDPAAVELERVMAACMEVLEPETWLKTGDVRDRLPEPRPHHNQVLRALATLHERGDIERDPAEPRRRAVYRWRLVASLHTDKGGPCEVKPDEQESRLPSHGGVPCEGRDAFFTSHGPLLSVGSEEDAATCVDCGGPLEAGQRYRCRACAAAAYAAVTEGVD